MARGLCAGCRPKIPAVRRAPPSMHAQPPQASPDTRARLGEHPSQRQPGGGTRRCGQLRKPRVSPPRRDVPLGGDGLLTYSSHAQPARWLRPTCRASRSRAGSHCDTLADSLDSTPQANGLRHVSQWNPHPGPLARGKRAWDAGKSSTARPGLALVHRRRRQRRLLPNAPYTTLATTGLLSSVDMPWPRRPHIYGTSRPFMQ